MKSIAEVSDLRVLSRLVQMGSSSLPNKVPTRSTTSNTVEVKEVKWNLHDLVDIPTIGANYRVQIP